MLIPLLVEEIHVTDEVTIRISEGGAGPKIFTPEDLKAGALVLPEPWMVWYIIEHPDEVRNLSRRQFQEFSAALLERKGLTVTVGPVGADGGVDVRAEREGEFGPELILVQTKHPDPGNKVTLETIKLLHYQVVTENATRGLVMTDSTFTRNALQQIAAYRFQMAGADGERIRQWLEALRTGTPGAQS
jgi:restriction endonuclease Mrr